MSDGTQKRPTALVAGNQDGDAAKQRPAGATFGGSASTGHIINLPTEDTLSNIFGTEDPKLADALMRHCLKGLKPGEAGDDGKNEDERHFMLSIVNDIAPGDAIERMLAVQMATTHVATIRAARKLANAPTLPQVQAHYTGFTKLARTFTAQAEALRKHRSGGTQTVVVQHVNVADGGQAIVGNITGRGLA